MSDSIFALSKEALEAYNGLIQQSQISQLLIMLQVHQVTKTIDIGSVRVHFTKGNVVGAENVLMPDVENSQTLENMVGYLMQQGQSYDDVLARCSQVLIDNLLSQDDSVEVSIHPFINSRPIELPYPVAHLLIDYCKTHQNDLDLLRQYAYGSRYNVTWVFDQSMFSQLNLPMSMLRFYRMNVGETSLAKIVPELARVTDAMKNFDAFLQLGLVSIDVREETRAARRKRRRRVRRQITSLAEERTQSSTEQQSAEDVSESLARLKTMHNKLFVEPEPAYQVFGLTAPNEVNDVGIDDAFRRLSAEWHPDRFTEQEEIDLATDVFTQLNELYIYLKDEDVRLELRKRLDVERRGEQYVSDADEVKSVMLLEQGRYFFKRRRYQDALTNLTEAFEFNPYNWRINTYIIRCEAELGLKSKLEVAELLENNTSARGTDRVGILFQAGEYYFQAENKTKAYELFAKVVELDEHHIDAKRYLHLRRKAKNTSSNNEPDDSSGFFSRFFGRK